MKRVVVIGSGISGLTTALHLKDRSDKVDGGLEVVVLEGRERPGGNIRTDRVDGLTMEWGPNGYLDNVPTTPALVRRLGLEADLQPADENAARRFLYRGGRLHELPTGALSFLTCPVLSVRGRLRVMLEPFARPRPEGEDETIYDFGRRRIGDEAARVLIDAMVSGVFAGNIHQLSLASTFPKMAAMEAEHGGLVKAMVAKMRQRRAAKQRAAQMRANGQQVEELTRPGGPAGPGGTLTSFRRGLDTLVDGLVAELDGAVRFERQTTTLRRAGHDTGPAWQVGTEYGEPIAADAVVLTSPSPQAAPLLSQLDPALGQAVGRIPTASLAVVALAYEGESPQGFGFLVPRGEGPRILGCLWDSSIFPGRAPAGKVLLRAMIGGAHDPEAVTLDDETLVDIVRRDLGTTMGLSTEPVLTRIFRHPLGIGQYNVGHQALLDIVHGRLEELPGLWLAGSSYYGVSMNACIEKAGAQATEIVEYLASDR